MFNRQRWLLLSVNTPANEALQRQHGHVGGFHEIPL